jgi:hypothetical protein
VKDEKEGPKGRSGSETRQRKAAKLTRYLPDELAEIEEAASRAGVTFSSFVRAASLTAARGGPKGVSLPVRSVRRPPVERELLARLLGQLGKVGSNVNQIARAANRKQNDETEIAETMQAVREAAQAIMKAMGQQP